MVGQGHLKDDAAGRSSRILVRSLSQVSGFSTYGSQPTDSRRREREFAHLFSRAVRLHQFGLGTMVAAACQSCQGFRPEKKKCTKSATGCRVLIVLWLGRRVVAATTQVRLLVGTRLESMPKLEGKNLQKPSLSLRLSQKLQWSSGRIHRCHRCDPGLIPG